jgi:uncharacterized membrane protein
MPVAFSCFMEPLPTAPVPVCRKGGFPMAIPRNKIVHTNRNQDNLVSRILLVMLMAALAGLFISTWYGVY